MSSAIATPDPLSEPQVSHQCPVRVVIGPLHKEHGHLTELSYVAHELAADRHPPQPVFRTMKPYEALRFGITGLTSPIAFAAQYSDFTISDEPKKSALSCMVLEDRPAEFWKGAHPAPSPPKALTDRLYNTGTAALSIALDNAHKAVVQFGNMETHSAARKSLPWRDAFQIYVTDNELMPDSYRQRTLALAHAHAAINVNAYGPAMHPRQALEMVSSFADLAACTIKRYCGIGDYPDPVRNAPANPGSLLPKHLKGIIDLSTQANTLSAQCARRYGLILAEGILAGRTL